MDDVKRKPFECVSVPIRLHEDGGGFDADDVAAAGGDETMSGPEELSIPVSRQPLPQTSPSRASELTISFEGEVYVFPAVTPEKVQAVLFLLGSQEAPNNIQSSLYNKAGDDVSNLPTVSRRIASLERFREKRKERCFEKKIRYNCRKEVALRMHRKNGQFASVKDTCRIPDDNWGSVDSTPCSEPLLRKCQHCGISETSTPAMRRGPAGPRTLCNACGLMWANKGTLRDLAKGGKHILDRSERGTLEIKPVVIEQDISYHNLDEERTPEQAQSELMVSGIPSVRSMQGMEVPEGIADVSSIRIETSCLELGEQEALVELANAAGSEFGIPANFARGVQNYGY